MLNIKSQGAIYNFLDSETVSRQLKNQKRNIFSDDDDVEISIICCTYNHEDYIEDALIGFLIQNTKVRFEIVFFDDCSTDQTRSIIESYKRLFPDIIRLASCDRNIFSQGVRVSAEAFKYCRGRYIALCDGDDFWINAQKLSEQYNFLEKNHDVMLLAHNNLNLHYNGEVTEKSASTIVRHFDPERVILAGGGLFATSSLFFRASVMTQFSKNFYMAKYGGDYIISVLAVCSGGVALLPSFGSVYRVGSRTSVSQMERILSGEEILSKALGMRETLSILDCFTGKRFANFIEFYCDSVTLEYSLSALVNARDVKSFKKIVKLVPRNRNVRRTHRMALLLVKFPLFLRILYKIYKLVTSMASSKYGLKR